MGLTNLVSGGGFLNDVTVDIVDAIFAEWDYRGKTDFTVPALVVKYKKLDDDEEVEQAYTVGSSDRYAIVDDGKSVNPIAPAKGIVKTSNCGLFLQSLLDCGLEPSFIDDDITTIKGMRVNVTQFAPQRPGIDKKNEQGYDSTVVIVDEIISMPGGALTEAEPSPDMDNKTQKYIQKILDAENGVSKANLAMKLVGLPGFSEDPDMKDILKRATSDDFLKSVSEWKYEGGVVKKS